MSFYKIPLRESTLLIIRYNRDRYRFYWIAIDMIDKIDSQVEKFTENLDQLGIWYMYLEIEGSHS